MKKLKYIKLFEAFESSKLSKTLGFIKDKNEFLNSLKKIADSIDLPYSKLSDDYFQYLPFKKALELNFSINDEPCEATSEIAFPGYSIEGEKCVDGHIKRRWGTGIRRVVCPICSGSGIKPKTNYEIKWIKFWFTKEGKYVASTITDGRIEKMSEYNGYIVSKTISSIRDWSDVNTGEKVSINIGRAGEIIGTFYRDGDRIFIIHDNNNADGSNPSENTWMKYGRYSWYIGGGEYVGRPKVLRVKKEDDVDPYSWNFLYKDGRIRKTDVESILKPAHFAIILDLMDIKKSEYKKKSEVRKEREESKEGALAFMEDSDIKKLNIERYIQEISKRIDIPMDLKDFHKVVLRYLGGYNIGYYVLRGRSFSNFNQFINYIYNMLTNENEDEKKEIYNYALSDLKRRQRDNLNFNNYVNSDLEKTSKEVEKERVEIINKLKELNKTIFEKIKSMKIENLDDIEILWEKINSIRNIWRTSDRFIYARKLYYAVDNLGDGIRLKRYLQQLEDNEIEKVLNDFTRLINLVKIL
jgi:hypothetical protein